MMKSKAIRSRRLSRMPNNKKLRNWFLNEKYIPHQKKEKKVRKPLNFNPLNFNLKMRGNDSK